MQHHRITGTWMINHVHDRSNPNPQNYLDIAIVDGKAYDLLTDNGQWRRGKDPIRLAPGDELFAWGNIVTFQADPGELDRIGRQFFMTV